MADGGGGITARAVSSTAPLEDDVPAPTPTAPGTQAALPCGVLLGSPKAARPCGVLLWAPEAARSGTSTSSLVRATFGSGSPSTSPAACAAVTEETPGGGPGGRGGCVAAEGAATTEGGGVGGRGGCTGTEVACTLDGGGPGGGGGCKGATGSGLVTSIATTGVSIPIVCATNPDVS